MKKRGKTFRKRGQIWIETLIYTLIALVMIGLVLTFAKPKIEEIQDNAIIEQSIKVLEGIDSIILSLDQGGAGNKRLIDLEIKKGVLNIDGVSDMIYFEMDSKSEYSQPGEFIQYGDLILYTEKKGEFNRVTLTRNYSGMYDITYKGEDELKTITKSPSQYKLYITHNGKNQNKTIIDFEI
ncbi:MAG TPA: hypothetical protein ENG87_05150 [Candidatus Pacearchaeota archaeon]|nr:hypothetical protein BMS3Abin17_00919 [archaeon BMS3Abin17]HDK42744.1 hypothetical protein [Candidatus Pacearchaeota archaeon]HDZ61402.1 hypothetical protein [Candidatus Pacearchaeota archaeon]